MCIHYVIYRYAHVLGIHLVSFPDPTHAVHVGSGNGTSIHHDIWTVVNYKVFDFGLQAIQPYYLPSGILCFYHLQMQFLCFNQFLVGGFQCFHSYNKYIGFLGSLNRRRELVIIIMHLYGHRLPKPWTLNSNSFMYLYI